ncbi:MAG: hypothetical protein Q4C48_02395 [Lachnospiraceae bacterium]|nr:hypothetical protein [Lachnospiraceae bacterium]
MVHNTTQTKPKARAFARPPKFKNRLILMIVGILLQSLGVSLLLKLRLGTDPCTCFTQGIIRYVPLTFGTAQVLCHLINFTIVLIFDRGKIGFGTIGNMCCLGYLSDFYTYLYSRLLPADFFESTAVRYGLLLPALLVFLVGAAAYMTADLGMSPYDGVPFIISDHVKKPSFKVVRILWDTAFLVGGFLLGSVVGVVTFLVAFFLGPVIAWMQKRLERFLTVSEPEPRKC